jgi:hypothetical protein
MDADRLGRVSDAMLERHLGGLALLHDEGWAWDSGACGIAAGDIALLPVGRFDLVADHFIGHLARR